MYLYFRKCPDFVVKALRLRRGSQFINFEVQCVWFFL